nr:VCBS repeat-containing protein [Chloroflexota bacterium]
MSVFAVDVDGDDDTDVLSASENDDKIAWYENRLDDVGCTPSTPALCWIPHTISTAANGAQSVYAADVDEDGNVDVFSASYNDNKIAWYENKLDDPGCTLLAPAACWSAHTISIAANGARSVYAADVDGDGDLDALSASQNDDKIAWYENTSGDGAAWTTHIIVDTHSGADRADGARSVYAADVDRDGDLDALSASYDDDKIAWYENTDGDGTAWTAHTISTDADGARSVFAAFVDEDGNVDVLSALYDDDEITWYDNPIGAIGSSIYNANPAADSVTVSGTILQSAGLAENQCWGEVTTGGYNLLHGGTCFTLGGTDISGDPELGPLRDNGGPTLTRALSTADSPAVEAGPFEADCAVETDQRGKTRPFDSPGGGGVRCDIGAVEYGADTLLVCETCNPDPDNLRFTDLQEALHRAMAGDVIAVEAGAYTGSFTAYKNATLQHAGINVATLSQDQPVGVRAILQASERTIREQHRLLDETQTDGLSGTVLTIEAYEYPAGPAGAIAVTDDVTVTLRGLTIRHGLSRQGGGIYNVGHLYVYTSTISENAVVNGLQGATVVTEAMGGAIYNVGDLTLERSTLSGNQSEYYGGAIYNDGSGSGGIPATVEVDFSTIAENRAEKIGAQRVVNIKDAGFDPGTLTVDSGDHIQFQDQTANAHTLVVDGEGCNLAEIEVPRQGGGLSEPLICSVSDDPVTITVRDKDNASLSMNITVNALGFTPEAHAIYVSGGEITVHRSLLVKSSGSSGDNCGFGGMGSLIQSEGYNLVDDDSCRLTGGTDLRPATEPNLAARLGPLQDNNAIDFVNNWISGYTYSHALKPGSSAMDHIPPDECGAATQHTINIASGSLDLTIEAGDVVKWTHTADSTVALDDGEANVNLVAVPAGGQSREVQFTEPGDYPYRVYANDTRAQIGAGVIEVASRVRAVDQRGTVLPQRGTGDTYRCDVGAYEFEPWIVGQPLSRPPAAIGTQPPSWEDGKGTELGLSYHAWSSATAQDYPLRPSPNDGDADLEESEIVTLKWETDPDPASQVEMALYGIVEWPADPQIHVSEAPAQLTHDDVSDGFQVSDARAFEGREPADDEAGQLLSVGVFARTVLPDIAGDSYSVLQFVKGNQANPTLKVQVVKTVDWNTPGVRDMRAERGVCEIGHEIRYRSYEDASGTLPGHEDPEDRPGQILLGEAFDGVRTEIDLARVQNTVDGLILPAHIRDAREGPIIPILNTAPTQLSGDLVTGDHDLRITWYRPDERDVAWPVKTIGYRCDWPADPPEIVIASELGSEIGGQAVLNLEGYSDVTVYHQPDPDEPGYNPNDEHALLASSNLGNSAPALYALRTDLADQPYALLKYRDPREDDQPKIAVYKVVLTREAEEITNITPDPGTITLLASASAAGVAQTNLQSQPSVTVRVGDGELPPGGDVTVLVEALGASNLRSATIKVSYDPDVLTPTACATNRLDSVEALYNLQITTDEPQQPFRTVHMRASLNAGTDAQYEWDFDDGTTRIAGAEVSHVYGAVGTYTVTVTASNGVFADVTATTQIEIAEDAVPGSLDDDDTIGCRIETDGELTIELKTRNKHGLSGNLTLTEVTFEATGDPPAEDTETSLDLTSISLFGPGYEDLSFNITAGNPVFAPTPLRGLLDIQPCPQTKATDVAARPFWRDFKDMLWARAAGDMDMLYFYPLQPGFHLTDDHAESLGLVDENGNVLSPDDRVGRCVPWMDELSGGQTETVPYAIPHTITTDADGARSVHAADVDGDGDVDVLSASFDDDTIAWYENTDGAGTFGPEQVITTDADGATSVYAADVDDDGDLDVLSASANDDKIAWYENDGTPANGGWIAHTLVTGADGARSVYAADADGDGNLDVLSASENNDRITWYENFDGDGWFYRSQVIADDADGARSVYAADVDDDGDVDVVSASFNDDKIAWYENQLNGFGCGPPWDTGECWTAHIISTNAGGATSVYAADVDGDDDVDILSASENDDKIAWYENTDGAGAFGPEQVITTDANGAVSVYAADVDGDGDLDALSASYYGDEIAWYENDGTPADGGWTAHTLSTDADGARSVYAADVDGDDDLDVLSASENDDKIAWYQNQSVRVLPVAYHADWPDLPPLLSVGETVYERAKSGISGVANQLAVSRIYDDLAPGAWDNDAAKIVIEGAEVQRSLAELIDPIGEARVEVGITINDNPALPEEIKTERLLFGGGLAIVGTTDNEITLPFALRSRITFDDIEGELVFKGYYDGASPEYIKGDPLLLLNVMSKSDQQRLEDLCQSGSADCQKYLDAIEELYHKTRNPRQVDLCRTADGELYVDDPDPADNQGAEDA